MYSVRRRERYVDTTGQSFRDFIAGRLAALPGERPTIEDRAAHLQTLMPEVRLKRVLETRGSDAGQLDQRRALPSFWVGLLYDPGAPAAWDLVKDWHPLDHDATHRAVPRVGLDAPCSGQDGAPTGTLDIARRGLERRDRQGAQSDESRFLAPSFDVVETGRTAARKTLEDYATHWHGSIDPIFLQQSY